MRTAIFDLAPQYGYDTLTKLANAMGMSVATVSRVRAGKDGPGFDFYTKALAAFPDKTFAELFPDARWRPVTDEECLEEIGT